MAPLPGQRKNWAKLKQRPRDTALAPAVRGSLCSAWGRGLGEKAGTPPRLPACASVLPPHLLWQNNSPLPQTGPLDHPTASPGEGPAGADLSCEAEAATTFPETFLRNRQTSFSNRGPGLGGGKEFTMIFFFTSPESLQKTSGLLFLFIRVALTCSIITLLSTYCAAAFPVLLPLAASSRVPVTLSLMGFQVSDVEIRKKRELVGDTVRINAPAFLFFSPFPFYFIHLISLSETLRLNEGLDRLLEAVDLEGEGGKSQREKERR